MPPFPFSFAIHEDHTASQGANREIDGGEILPGIGMCIFAQYFLRKQGK